MAATYINLIDGFYQVPVSCYTRLRYVFTSMSGMAQKLALLGCKKAQVRSLGGGTHRITIAEAQHHGVPPHHWASVVAEIETFAGVGLGNYVARGWFTVPVTLSI